MSQGSEDEAQVTSEWLEQVLATYHSDVDGDANVHISVTDFSVRPGCSEADNVLSDILAVDAQYKHSGEDQPRKIALVVKLLPQDPFSRFFVTEAQFDLREIKFYTQVVPDLLAFQKRARQDINGASEVDLLPIAKCFHARYSEGCESVLVLENLKTRGYRGVPFSRGLNRAQATAALQAIARVHALSLALKVREDVMLPERFPFLFQTDRATDSYQHLVERGLPQLARFLESKSGFELILERLRALRSSTKELIAELLAPEEPMALITHTDFWCNNLLFVDPSTDSKVDTDDDGDGGFSGELPKCAILDWQMVTYSRPTNDIALLIISSLPTSLRRNHQDDLLDSYWNALTDALASLGIDIKDRLGYDKEQLKADYKRSLLLALLLCIGSVDVALGDERTEKRLLDVLEDLNNEGLL